MSKDAKSSQDFRMPDYSEKLILSMIYLTNNQHIDSAEKSRLWEYILNSQQQLFSLEKDGFIKVSEEGELALTPLGVSIAARLFKIGVNFERSAKEGKISNSMAMLNGALAGIKEKILSKDITLYKHKQLYTLLVSTIKTSEELLKHAIDSDQSTKDLEAVLPQILSK